MEDFYEEGTWIIVERAESDHCKVVKDGNSSVSRFVCKNRLKKINS
jgi:hypothetical protein